MPRGRPQLARARALAAAARAAADFFEGRGKGRVQAEGEAAAELAWAAAEAERFGLLGELDLAPAARAISDAAEELLAAFESGRAERLVAAKKHASEAERLCRLAKTRALESPETVWALKMGGVVRRLSHAAEGIQKTADALGAAWASKA